MSDVTLGTTPGQHHERDAIHVAVIPMVAAETLKPGQRVALTKDGKATATGRHVGIVDPFFEHDVQRGQTFWLALFPNSVTGMRHHWSHPAFPAIEERGDIAASEEWLRQYAERVSPYDEEMAYERFMDRVRSGSIFYNGSDLHGHYELEQGDELFGHLSIVLGRPVGADSFSYSCSC